MKPDLRFRDAVNNDIEIVTGADQVLVYDRPINAGGSDGVTCKPTRGSSPTPSTIVTYLLHSMSSTKTTYS
jgi:hypothetical protein